MSEQVVPVVLGLGFVAGLTGFALILVLPPDMVAARAQLRPAYHFGTRRGIVAAAVALATLVLTRWPVAAVIAGGASLVVPDLFTGAARREAAIAKTEAVASWAEMLRDTLASSAGLEETILATAPVAPEPIRVAIGRLVRRLEHAALEVGLRHLADDLADPTADLVVSSLIIASAHPVRDLGGLLGSLASSARQRAGMQLRVEAGRARTRTAVRMVTLFTLGFTLGMLVLNRGYLAPFDAPLGQLVLLLVGTLFLGAFWLLERMAKVAAPQRCIISVAALEPLA